MNPLPAEPVNALLNFLREADGYALLRNPDIIANLARGGDIDLVASDPKGFVRQLFRNVGLPLVMVNHCSTWILLWQWGRIDLTTSLDWLGANYINYEEVIQQARRNKADILEASPVHQAVICWLTNLLWGGRFKDRYKEFIIETARNKQAPTFYRLLAFAISPDWASRLIAWAREGHPERSAKYINSLRWALWWQSLKRSPFKTLNGWFRFGITALSLRLFPPTPWISLTGLDDESKIALINLIREHLGHGKPFISIYDAHWRSRFFHSKSMSVPAKNFHGKPQQTTWISLKIILSSLMGWILEYWLRLVHLRAKGYLLVFDHHPLELRVNPCPFGKLMWILRLIEKLVPQPDLFIFLDLPAEAAHSRQPEIPVQELQHLRERYLRLAQTLPNAYVIDANRPLEEIVEEVEDLIIEEMHKRTQKHLQRLGLL